MFLKWNKYFVDMHCILPMNFDILLFCLQWKRSSLTKHSVYNFFKVHLMYFHNLAGKSKATLFLSITDSTLNRKRNMFHYLWNNLDSLYIQFSLIINTTEHLHVSTTVHCVHQCDVYKHTPLVICDVILHKTLQEVTNIYSYLRIKKV